MSASAQLVVFTVIAALVILSATFLVSLKAVDAQAYTTLVGAIVGGIVGILNPVKPSGG